jgi:phosphoglycerol geranylgeranyltransferase
MNSIYNKIVEAKNNGEKLLAILLDPDKLDIPLVEDSIKKINGNNIDFIFVGGSTVKSGITEIFVKEVKKYTIIPVILFPGDYKQITNEADAVLFLSLLSGKNPEYLIEQQIRSVPLIQRSKLEIIPTGYILIDGGTKTSVQKVSKTIPISQNNHQDIVQTSIAAMYLGKKLIYLEAGSGAKNPVGVDIINSVKEKIDIPLIVGGGIRSQKQLINAFDRGADMVVIGTAFEENIQFINKIGKNESIY